MATWGKMEKSGILWSIGATSIFPTGVEEFTQDQFQLGPAAIFGVLKDWGVLGVFWQHWWGINPPEGTDRANTGTLQLFYWFSVGNGWQVGGSPVPTANYLTASDINFSIPLNLGVAKTLMVGSTPIKATVQAQYFVTQPDDFGPSWGIFFQITPVIKVPW